MLRFDKIKWFSQTEPRSFAAIVNIRQCYRLIGIRELDLIGVILVRMNKIFLNWVKKLHVLTKLFKLLIRAEDSAILQLTIQRKPIASIMV